MDLIAANHSSYPRIGEDAEEQILRRTIGQFDRGEKAEADVHAAENRLTELALEEQAAAGLDVVTDGQIRWYDPVSHLAGKLEGVRINGLLRFFDTNFYFRQPVVSSPPIRREALLVDEFRFAQARSRRAVKAVLTGAYTLARLSLPEDGVGGFEKLIEGYTAALAKEVAALVAGGATRIQVEEPAVLKRPADLGIVASSLAALGARKGGAELALALYFGDPAPLYEKLQQAPVDTLVLDFTYNPGLVDVVSAAGSEKTLGLGLIDGRNTRLEDTGSVLRSLERMLAKSKSARAYLMPSCGLEYLPRDRARLKLQRLASIKEALQGGAR
jgi:5-methyltetrahydropteroyltriglutamate--homocysteine methyltransferase